ncbi:MAG: ATP-binding cassette domain-containing protein [Flavobacteriia bacterium]|nr:ATP-binding cassette domain-containing protein [Flavobacteriia bacterium]
MNQEILHSLMQLFAIITKQDETCWEIQDAYVKDFLSSQISAEKRDGYYQEYQEYLKKDSLKIQWTNKISVKDSVHTLAICKKINATFSLKQKTILLVWLAEFTFASKEESKTRIELLTAISNVFHVLNDELQNIFFFVRAKDDDSETNEQTLINKHKTLIVNHQNSAILFLYIESINILFFHYKKEEIIRLNGQLLTAKKVYIFSEGAAIKTIENTFLQHDILSLFRASIIKNNIHFSAKIPLYKFKSKKVALKSINVNENGGTLIGIMGSSGSGKTTLLNVLSGINPITKGTIFLNGHSIYSNESKSNIGYISQDDLLMEELTVYQNLYFNAKLVNEKWGKEELKIRIKKVLIDLGLYDIKDNTVGSVIHNNISGGQRKRLNIALELLRDPLVLFVDEPTSGLSSKDSENVISIFKRLTEQGKIVFIVIHQPSSEIFKHFDKLFILDEGGLPVYYGNTLESIVYFKTISNQINQDISECPTCSHVSPEQIFDILEEKKLDEFGHYTSERKIPAKQWHTFYKNNYDGTIEKNQVIDDLNFVKKPSLYQQFKVFFKRDFYSRIYDKQYLLIVLLEAPLLAGFLSFIIKSSNNTDENNYLFSFNKNIPAYIFMLIIVTLFISLTVSAEEIFKDRRILKREHLLQLSRLSYLSSKVCYLLILSLIQSFLLCIIGNSIIELAGNFFYYWVLIFSIFVFGNITGLMLSSSLKSIVAIYIIIPIIIIPQIVLSGAMFKFENLNKSLNKGYTTPLISNTMISKWGFESLMVIQFTQNKYEKTIFQYDQLLSDCAYRTTYLFPYLTDLVQTKKENSVCSDTIFNTLKFESERDFVKNKFHFHFKKQMTIAKAKESIDLLSEYYQSQYNKISRLKDSQLMQLRNKLGKKEMMQLKTKFYNDDVADLVQNTLIKKKYFVENSRVYQNYDHIYLRDHLAPNYSLKGTFMFVPNKKIGEKIISTFSYNLIVIWLLNISLFFILYFDILKKILNIKLINKNESIN